jgi:hypothetical protein
MEQETMSYQTDPGPAAPHGPPGMPGAPQGKRGNKGCLYAVIACTALFALLGACGAILSAVDSTSSGGGAGAAAPEKSDGEPEAEPTKKGAPKAATNGIGKEYRDGKFAFTVTKVRKGVQEVGDQYFGQKAQGQFVLVYVTVNNIGDEARTFDSSGQYLFDTGGRKFEADGEAGIAMGDQSKAFLEDINPGNSVKGILVFDVPKGVKLKSIELHDSPFSGGVTVPLGNR